MDADEVKRRDRLGSMIAFARRTVPELRRNAETVEPIAPADGPPTVAMSSASTAHFVCEPTAGRLPRAEPADGFQLSANFPNATYTPPGLPANGGRFAAIDDCGSNPEPDTDTVV